ncbi:MAG: M23 family peptidase, partial [Paeniglutamicibacter sp.]
MTQQQNSGRRRASSPVDASPADGSLEQIVDTAMNGESTSRRPGRRASSAVPDSLENPETRNYGGRRFVASPRYSASPDAASIAATEIPAAPVARPVSLATPAEGDKLENVLKSAPRSRRPRLGFAHKLAAVAAVTGLAFAAAPAQDADEVAAAPQRVSQTSVADVKAPADDKLTVERASVTSKYVEPAPVTTAAAGKVATKAKPAPATTADTGKVTKLSQPVDSIRLT